MKPKVTISIALYGSLEYTKQCLKFLLKNTPEDLFQIYLFNNASKDNTLDWLVNQREIEFPDGKVKLMNSPVNIGFGKAHNEVAKKCDTEYLLLLNNDTVPLKGWLEPMLEIMEKRPEVEVVGSKLISPLVNGIQHAGVIFDGIYPRHIYFGVKPDDPKVNKVKDYPAVTGACFLVRTKTFLEGPSEKYPFKTIGLDEKYFVGWEDIDYCMQMQAMGKTIVYQPKSVLIHYEGRSEGRFVAEDTNREHFIKLWGKFITKNVREELVKRETKAKKLLEKIKKEAK